MWGNWYVYVVECVLLWRISCSGGGGGGGHVCCIVKCCNCHFISAGDMAGVACRDCCVCVCMCVCVCAVGKMAKDIGMTIRKSIVVSFLPCSVAFLVFHPYMHMFFHFLKCFLLLVSVAFLGGGGGEKTMIVVVAQLQLAPTYTKGPTDNCKALRAKIACSRNIQHRKRGGY